MYNLGITDNLNRGRIRKLLAIGLFGCVLTGVGDFLLGYADSADVGGGAIDGILATAPNLPDWQMMAGGLLGVFGLLLEGLCFFAVYRLMVDAAPRYAHIYRTGIVGYVWLAPIGCHLNVGTMNYAYKYLLQADPSVAHEVIGPMYLAFCLPVYVLLVVFWLPAIVVQWKAFAKGLTPYPTYAKWFNVIVGGVPVLVLSMLLGPDQALGQGIGTMFLSVGNALMFGGLLATMPSQERFDEFRARLGV